MQNVIVCRDLRKRYPGKPPVDAVNGLNLEVHEGECFGLLGPNGAGKTTTIEILEGLLPASSGDVEVLGMKWAEHEYEIKARIGISLQETKLSDKLSVIEIVRLFRSFYKQGPSPEHVIEMVGLTEKSKAWNKKLSGGQKQRLAIACALVGDPDLLFLDEPTTGLDPQSRRQLWDIIRDCRDRNKSVLLTTHYMDEAERLCDRVAIVDKGQVIALGTPRDLIAKICGENIIEFSLQTTSNPGDAKIDSASFATLPAVSNVQESAGVISLTVSEPHVAVPALLDRLRRENRGLASLTTRHASLEDVFVSLTGRHLAEEGEKAAS